MTSEPESEFQNGDEREAHPAAESGAVPDEIQPGAELPPEPSFAIEPRPTPLALGKVQLTGRVLLYLFLTILILPPFVYSFATKLFGRQRGGLSAEFLLFMEATNFVVLLALTLLIAYLEQIPWGDYGLPWKQAFKVNFWVGMLLGLAEGSVLIGLIEVFGGFSLEGWELRGRQIVQWALFHFVLFVFVGLYEEFLFRGYPQMALSKVIGFWPAAILLSTGFGLVHLNNRGENWVGISSVALVGLLFAFTLKRSGNLWYAVGIHAGFDWAQSFLYSVPDSGELLQGHLWNTSLHGPDWLTGGTVGPEGSVFCFLTMFLQFLVVLWLFPAKKAETAKEETAPVTPE